MLTGYRQNLERPINEYELLDLLTTSPETVANALPELGHVHQAEAQDVFSDTAPFPPKFQET
jgi:hypothetical protein